MHAAACSQPLDELFRLVVCVLLLLPLLRIPGLYIKVTLIL